MKNNRQKHQKRQKHQNHKSAMSVGMNDLSHFEELL